MWTGHMDRAKKRLDPVNPYGNPELHNTYVFGVATHVDCTYVCTF